MQGRRRARWSRRLGCDGNPLRRATDRAEIAVRVAVGVLILTAVPAAGIAAGKWVDHLTGGTPGRNQATGDIFLAVTLAMLVVAFAVLGTAVLAHRMLLRRRMSAWDAEWRSVAPSWSGYRT